MDNPAEVADKADRIITMLPSSPNVIDVYTGPNGILKYLSPFLILNPKLWPCNWAKGLFLDINLAAVICRKVKKGSLLIDSSTIDPAVSKEMAVAAEKMGAVFMDAPVSGGNV